MTFAVASGTVWKFLIFGFVIGKLAWGVLKELKKQEKDAVAPKGLPPPLPRRATKKTAKRLMDAPAPRILTVPVNAAPAAVEEKPAEVPMALFKMTRKQPTYLRSILSDRDALRRAIIAREVLGEPVALRRPRF